MKKIVLVLLIMAFSNMLNAQEKTVSGIVSDASGPLPGVNVIVKGTTESTRTNFEGKYTIKATDKDVLVYSFVGLITEEKLVGAATVINVTLKEDPSVLDEVIVTAQGIKREKKALGYAVSSIKSESTEHRKEGDVARVLSGKASGVRISGSSKPIVIRGVSSIKGRHKKNQPKSGLLTAGEINDHEKWIGWINTLKKQKYKKIQKDWNFQLENKIDVVLTDAYNMPLSNVKVSLYNETNTSIMVSRTDAEGKVVLFKDLNEICDSDYYVVQANYNGKVVGKKIVSNQSQVALNLEANKSSNNDVDIMFTIDATGSMGDEIDYLKSELKNIISRLDESIEKKRVALTFYRDKGDEYIVKDFDFNSNIDNVKEILDHQYARGGGDYEEAVEQALKVSMSKSWMVESKSKLLFLLLDAPPHFTQENVETIKEQIKIAQEKGIKIIPIVASGADKTVEFLMRFFSVSTNGTYVFLTDDSGIGNPHLKPSTEEFKVEKLNDLIVRLIEKYSGVVKNINS